MQDAVGHGDSDVGPGFQSWQQSADDASTILKNKHPDKTDLIGMGHSFGGILTLQMAAKNQGMFKKVILLDPILMPQQLLDMQLDMKTPNPMSAKALSRRNSWQNRQEAKEYFLSKSIYKTWTAESIECFLDYALEVLEDGTLTLKCPPSIEASIFGSGPQGIWSLIEEVEDDIHIIYGSDSYPFIEMSCQQAGSSIRESLMKNFQEAIVL